MHLLVIFVAFALAIAAPAMSSGRAGYDLADFTDSADEGLDAASLDDESKDG